MFKAVMAALSFTLAAQVQAATTNTASAVTIQSVAMDAMIQGQHQLLQDVHTQALDWKVGDENDYNLNIGGFIKGGMVMKVREVGADGIWMDQNMDLGFAGKQNASMLLDPNTGEIKKMLVNGKEQAVPKQNVEVVEVTEDHITVPAGSFDCVHARILDKDTKKESNAWINPQLIPLSGMLKTVQPTPVGDMTVELKSFHKTAG
jgi:hypothetical protein